jgi:hypothetical protein
MTAPTRRRLPGVFVFLLLVMALTGAAPRLLAAPAMERILLAPWVTQFLSAVAVLFIILGMGLIALTSGIFWAASWRVMIVGRWSAPRALAAAVRRFWSFYALLVLCLALPLLSILLDLLVPALARWSQLAFLASALRPVIPALLLFVPWSLMRRPRGLRGALRDNFALLRAHWRPLGWFALRFTALTLLVVEGSTALVAGIHPGVVSGLLGLAPPLFVWAASLTVALVYASLAGVRLAPEQVPAETAPKIPA